MKSTSRLTTRDLLKSQSVMKKRRKKRLLKLYLISFAGILLVTGLAYASRMETVQIKKVVVVGNETVSGEEIEKVSNVILDASYMGVFPKRNSLIFPKDQISKTLISTFPKIESLDIETESFGYLNVRIRERAPAVEWCNAIHCYFVDESGYIFSMVESDTEQGEAKRTEALEAASTSTSTASGDSVATSTEEVAGDADAKAEVRAVEKIRKPGSSALLRITGLDEVVGTKPVGKTLMPVELLKKVREIATGLDGYGLKVREIEFRSEDEIVYKVLGNGRIIFNQRRPLGQSYENLVTALKSDVFAPRPAPFEYIDTRFGNKVFYKLR